MGTQYFIGCFDCQIYRDIDKHDEEHILYINDVALYPEKTDFWTKQSHEKN